MDVSSLDVLSFYCLLSLEITGPFPMSFFSRSQSIKQRLTDWGACRHWYLRRRLCLVPLRLHRIRPSQECGTRVRSHRSSLSHRVERDFTGSVGFVAFSSVEASSTSAGRAELDSFSVDVTSGDLLSNRSDSSRSVRVDLTRFPNSRKGK